MASATFASIASASASTPAIPVARSIPMSTAIATNRWPPPADLGMAPPGTTVIAVESAVAWRSTTNSTTIGLSPGGPGRHRERPGPRPRHR